MQKGLLLVGHGSSLPFNQELLENTAAMIAQKYPDFMVRIGFMRINRPTIEESLTAFSNDPVSSVVVVPLFLAKGIHIDKDIPEKIGFPEGSRKGVLSMNGKAIPMVYADPIGAEPRLADMMMSNAANALNLL